MLGAVQKVGYDVRAEIAALRARDERYQVPDDWRVIDRELQRIARRRAELDAEEARFLRAAERQQIWRLVALPSMLAYMESRLGYGPRAAFDRMRVARALVDLPQLEGALSRNELSYSAVRELTRIVVPHTEAAWLAAAQGKNLRQVEDMLRGREKGDTPDTPPKADVVPRRVTLELTPAAYALYRQAQAALDEEVGRRLDDSERITMMCRRSLETNTSERTRAQYQIAVTICEACKRGWQHAAGQVIELDKAAIEVAQCDAQRIGRVDAEKPARAVQDIPPSIRRLVWMRDQGRCQVPGCRSGRNCDIHHIRPRALGGTHEPSNLCVMCSACHLALHRGFLTVTGSAPNLVFERHDMPAETIEARVRRELRDALLGLGVDGSVIDGAVSEAIAHVGIGGTFGALLRHAVERCAARRSGGSPLS